MFHRVSSKALSLKPLLTSPALKRSPLFRYWKIFSSTLRPPMSLLKGAVVVIVVEELVGVEALSTVTCEE